MIDKLLNKTKEDYDLLQDGMIVKVLLQHHAATTFDEVIGTILKENNNLYLIHDNDNYKGNAPYKTKIMGYSWKLISDNQIISGHKDLVILDIKDKQEIKNLSITREQVMDILAEKFKVRVDKIKIIEE